MASPPSHSDIAIIGSGFSGLGAAIRLKQEGYSDFVVLERANEVGGVWRENVYPGCACDVPSHLYSFSFAPNPSWSRTFSPQSEIQGYLKDCATRFGITPHLRFEHDVHSARWEESERHWRLDTSKGEWTSRMLVLASGALNEPSFPRIPGLESFSGKVMHSSRWDPTYDIEGKRVAVIGTGASAIQIIPSLQPRVARLTVFQRTPPWVMPRHDRAIGPLSQALFRKVPFAQSLARAGQYLVREFNVLGLRHPRLIRLVELLALRYLKRCVSDPELRAKLTPSYRMGCKRIVISDDYLPSLTRPNVEVVTEALSEVRAASVVTASGREMPVDALVFGTGFQVLNQPMAHKVRGRDGRSLAETWAGSPKAYLGTTVSGFPNLFLLQGPNTGLGHTSVLLMIEAQVEHLLSTLRFLDRNKAVSVEPKPDAQAAFVAEVDSRLRGTVWNAGGCTSWYLDSTGRNSSLWPGFTFTFRRRVKDFEPKDYLVRQN